MQRLASKIIRPGGFALILLLVAGIVLAEPVLFTGDAPADFDSTVYEDTIYVPDPEGTGDVGLPGTVGGGGPADPPPGAVSGWDIVGIYFNYDPIADIMYVGLDCVVICGDADGDGDPGGTSTWLNNNGGEDLPVLDEEESITLLIDANQDDTYETVVGVSAADDTLPGNPPNDLPNGFGAYNFVGSPAAPQLGFGTQLPNTTTYHNSPTGPDAGVPDFEFTVEDFSTLPGFSFTPGDEINFSIRVAAGAGFRDDGIGEDFMPQSEDGIPVTMPGAAELGDYVWEDSNLDGLQTEGGTTGIGNVPVEAVFAGADDTFGTADDETYNTTTNASGLYLFSPLEPGDYRVTFPGAGTIGYADRTIQNADGATGDAGDNNQDSDADETTGETTTITLEADESDLRWDAGYYNLAAIGDYVWEDLNADGIQNEGGATGLSGVTVNLTGTDGLGNAVSQTTTTDASGFYLFDGLVPGEYQVEFVAPAGYTTTLINQTGGAGDSNDAPDDSDADRTTGRTTSVTLSSGEEDLRWDAGYFLPSTLGDYVWQDLDEDGLQDDNEPGVSGVTVILRDSSGTEIERTTTDANGLYLFDNLRPGDYIIQFNAPPGFIITRQDAQSNSQDTIDSDADRSTGRTEVIRLPYDTTDLTWDMGIYESVPTATPPPGDTPPPDSTPPGDEPGVTATPPPVSELPTTGEAPFWRDGLMLLLLAVAGALMTGAGWMAMGRNSN